jgi:hypothetical protein
MTTPRLEAGHTLPQKTTFSLPCALRRRGPWGGGGGGRGDATVHPRGAPKLLGPKQGSAPGAGHLSAPPCPVRGRRRPPRPGRRPATGDGRPARSEAKEARPGRRETTPAPGRNHRCAGDTWPASVEARPGAGPAASIGRAPGSGPGPADTADTDLLSVTREWRAPPASTSEPEAAPPGGAMCEPARKYMFCPESPPPPFPPGMLWHHSQCPQGGGWAKRSVTSWFSCSSWSRFLRCCDAGGTKAARGAIGKGRCCRAEGPGHLPLEGGYSKG